MAKKPYNPRMNLWIGDTIAETQHLSLAETGAWLRIRLAACSSPKPGTLVRTQADLARLLGCSNDQVMTYVVRLADEEHPVLIVGKTADGRLKIDFPSVVHDLERSAKYAANGSKGGNPLLKQRLKQEVNQNTGLGNGISSRKEGSGGKTNDGDDDGDDLDREIRAHFASSTSLMWSPRAHSDVRFLVEKVGWPDVIRLLNMAIAARKSDPSSYARGIHRREESDRAAGPQSTPEGKWASKPYCPG